MIEDCLGGHSTRVKRDFIVMDSNRANMLKAIHYCGLVIICCITYAIYLVVQGALGLGGKGDGSHCHHGCHQPGRKIDFNRGAKGNKLLRQNQAYIGLLHHHLLQDVPAR